jgi:hypothetical protein
MAVEIGTNAGFVIVAPVDDPSGLGTRQVSAYSRAQQDTSPAGSDLYVDEIGWWCDNATEEANWEAAIYDDTGSNIIQNIVGTKSGTNAKGTAAGWKRANGLYIPIPAETLLWVAIQVDETTTVTNIDYSVGGARYVYYSGATTLEDPFYGASYSTSGPLAIYAVVKSSGGGSIIPILAANRRRIIS